MGADYALANLNVRSGCACAAADGVASASSRGQQAAALGCVYGGATVAALVPDTPVLLARGPAPAIAPLPVDPRPASTAMPSSRPRTSWPRSAW